MLDGQNAGQWADSFEGVLAQMGALNPSGRGSVAARLSMAAPGPGGINGVLNGLVTEPVEPKDYIRKHEHDYGDYKVTTYAVPRRLDQ